MRAPLSHRAGSSGPAGSARIQGTQLGMVGGVEALAFGVLIFVVGTLLVVNVWAVVDAKLATSSAAREAARTYVEAPAGGEGDAAARRAAEDAIASFGRDPARLQLTAEGSRSFVRCERVTFVARYRIPAISLPFGIGLAGDIDVTSRHSEIIDPLRNGLGSENTCGF